MCIGPDEGCQVVPEPIAPIDTMLVLLDPTLMPISLPFITINGPMFIEPMADVPSMPGIWPIGLADGRAFGIGMFMSIFF